MKRVVILLKVRPGVTHVAALFVELRDRLAGDAVGAPWLHDAQLRALNAG
jgi:hypothetical protein